MVDLNVTVVAWDRLDAAMEENLLIPEGRARKAITSMIATTPGMGGGGGASVVGESPIIITDQGDGTGTIETVGTGAAIQDNGDGTITVTIGGGTV